MLCTSVSQIFFSVEEPLKQLFIFRGAPACENSGGGGGIYKETRRLLHYFEFLDKSSRDMYNFLRCLKIVSDLFRHFFRNL
jgi:hypothetical protein